MVAGPRCQPGSPGAAEPVGLYQEGQHGLCQVRVVTAGFVGSAASMVPRPEPVTVLPASFLSMAARSADRAYEAVMAVVTVVDQLAAACVGVDEEQKGWPAASSGSAAWATDRRGVGILLTVIDGPTGRSRPGRG